MPKIVLRAEAKENNLTQYFTGKPCKHGHVDFRNTATRICMECDRVRKKILRETKPEKIKALKRNDYYKHQEHNLAQKQKYRQANKGKIMALVSARKKVVKQRTPLWLTKFDKLKIKCVYQMAAMYTRVNGEPWHVDHIVPLQGKTVSGLHVPDNLQVMRGIENISKKNKYEVAHAQ